MSSLSLVALERGLRPPTHLVGAVNVAGTIRTRLLRRSVSWTEYVGGERQEEGFEISNSRLNQMEKTHCVGGARIAYRIWEVAVTAIPVLIGTKFDDFVQLPIDVQWTIASQVG
ncbi:unnamed protein product [Camellia sinensis]